jgi:hypothetical protein
MKRPDPLDLDALVLAEIESLGRWRPAHGDDWPGATRERPRSGLQPAPEPAPGQARTAPQRTGPAAPIRPTRGQGAAPATRPRSGEEAEGLFDEPFERCNPDRDPQRDSAEDGPTATDLLSPEEQAFVARAAGFLSGRLNADLILDRIWSQANESRLDGFYDPDRADLGPDDGNDPDALGAELAEGPDEGPDQGPAPAPAQTASRLDGGREPGAAGPASAPAAGLAAARPVPVAGQPRGSGARPGPRTRPGTAPAPETQPE